MTSIRKSLLFSFIERYLLIAISLASNILLARLLTPDEIGVYSVSLAVIGIAQVLRDFGIGNFLIQEKELTEAHIRTAFGFSLVMGGLLFSVTYCAAPFAGDFYGEERMIQTMRISALNFLTLPFCTISKALLAREMAFKPMLWVNLVAAVVCFAVSITLAYAGFGVNSMAIGAVALNIVTGIGTWLVRPSSKLLLPSFSEWRRLLNFGAMNSASGIVTTLAMDVNDLVLGKVLGFAPVAMISRAQGLMNLFHRDIMGAIRNVAFPVFSKAKRDEQPIEEMHSHSVALITLIAWPFYGFVSIFPLEIIRLMFGAQWDDASNLVPIFCLAGAVAATSNLVLTCIMAAGHIELVTKAELIFQPIRAALIVFCAITFKTLISCAIAYLVSFVLYTLLVYKIKQKCIANDLSRLFSYLWSSFKVTIVTLTLPFALCIYTKLLYIKHDFTSSELSIVVGYDNKFLVSTAVLIIAAILSAFIWFASLTFINHPIKTDPLFKRIINKLPRIFFGENTIE